MNFIFCFKCGFFLLKVFFFLKKLETKLNLIEAAATSTSSTLSSSNDSILSDQTPSNNKNGAKLLNKYKSEIMQMLLSNDIDITSANNTTKHNGLIDNNVENIIEKHINSNSKFNITLKLSEMNKICNLLMLNYEFKLSEIYDINKRVFIKFIYCLNKVNNLAFLIKSEVFEEKLVLLRDMYARYIEDVSVLDVLMMY